MDKKEIKELLGVPKAALLMQIFLVGMVAVFGVCLATASGFTLLALAAVGICTVISSAVSVKSGNWVLVLADVLACGICVYIYIMIIKLTETLG
ncbi:MAG: hypothetical protein PHG02_10225 [Oscillospiraceae bacterium]|nr:hypothetical protein [Oscillospiraceae bacterium]